MQKNLFRMGRRSQCKTEILTTRGNSRLKTSDTDGDFLKLMSAAQETFPRTDKQDDGNITIN